MPRRHRRRTETRPREARRPSTTSPIDAPDGWQAERHRGGESGPDYVCPRCHRGVSRTSEHVVAWSTGEGDEHHRHWHTECWRSAVREGIDRYRWS